MGTERRNREDTLRIGVPKGAGELPEAGEAGDGEVILTRYSPASESIGIGVTIDEAASHCGGDGFSVGT